MNRQSKIFVISILTSAVSAGIAMFLVAGVFDGGGMGRLSIVVFLALVAIGCGYVARLHRPSTEQD